MMLKIRVISSSKEESVTEEDGVIIVKVRAKAEKNKANMAVVKLLEKYYGKRVRIVYGMKSKDKMVEIE
ncbi:MAG: DUF167 family protein [Candidatus Nitrosocaldaceae archaeon]